MIIFMRPTFVHVASALRRTLVPLLLLAAKRAAPKKNAYCVPMYHR